MAASRRFHQHVLLAWLLLGSLLALALPHLLDSALLGWTGLYWLLGVPLLMLTAMTCLAPPTTPAQAARRPAHR